MNRFYLTMAGSIAVLAGAVLAALWVTRPPAVPSVSAADAGDFVLAPAVSASDPASVDTLLTREIWPMPSAMYSRASQLKARESGGKADETWKLTGTYRIGSQPFVLLRVGDKTPETLKPGDTLPDGRRIVEIQEERIWVVADGKRVALELRPK
jgi:hypothetical protein